MSRPILIENVSLAGQVDGNVLVVDGEIAAMQGSRIDAPADAIRIDATGLIALPGLVDLHTHLPSSLKTRTRALDIAMAPISASCVPPRPTVTAPTG